MKKIEDLVEVIEESIEVEYSIKEIEPLRKQELV